LVTRDGFGIGSIEGCSTQIGGLKDFSLQNHQDGSLQLGTLQDYLNRYGEERFKPPPASETVRADDPVESFEQKTIRESADMMDLPLGNNIGAERKSSSYYAKTVRFFHDCLEKRSGIYANTTEEIVHRIIALESPEQVHAEALSSVLTFIYAGEESFATQACWSQGATDSAHMAWLLIGCPIELFKFEALVDDCIVNLYFLRLNGNRVSRIRLTPQGAASEIVRLGHIDGYEDADLEAVKDDILGSIGAPWKVWL
jgi:hypothetical protein